MAASEPSPELGRHVAGTSELVDYAKSLDCIHCGLCLQTCPTYLLSGVETSSPRGRIHLMRAVGEGRLEPDEAYAEELSFCLLCRHCESVCPAGVRFGAMMETARSEYAEHRPPGPLARLARWLGFRVVLPSRLALRGAVALLRAAQLVRADRLAPLLGRRGAALRDLPRVPPRRERLPLPRDVPARGEERREVALLEGCVQPELFGRVNRATVRALSALGVRVRVPEDLVCCGSLAAHNGDREGARALAERVLAALEATRGADGRPLPFVVNAAGCGSHLRELAALFPEDDPRHPRALALEERVLDLSELVAELLPRDPAPRLPAGALRLPVAWDDPCHLCHGQGIRSEPRAVLDGIEGLERVEMDDAEACCGSAGIYSLLRPKDAEAVFAFKLDALRRSGARTLVTANPGCQLQWETGLRRAGLEVDVRHLAEVAALALGEEGGRGSASG